MNPKLIDYLGAEQWFGDTCPEAAAVIDAEGTLYLLSEGEDGAFYVGIPMSEDEDGDEVDRNTGWLDPTRRAKGAYGPLFPLTVVATGRMAMFVNGSPSLAEIDEVAP